MTMSVNRIAAPAKRPVQSRAMSSKPTALCPPDQLVRGQTGIQNLPGGLRARHGQGGWVEKTELNEHGRLIPVDVLVGELPVAELNDDDKGDFHPLAGWRHAREHPLHLH